MVSPHAYSPAQLGLLADAVLAGLSFDLQPAPAVWVKAAVAVPAPEPLQPAPPTPILRAPAIAPAAPAAAPAVAPIAAQVWHQGGVGGVAVVVQAAAMPTGAAATLLGNMLRAVGLQGAPVAWVGVQGTPAAAEIIAALNHYQPTHILILGQGALQPLAGKNLGVEGWHAAPQALGLTGRVGVTYPLELLLAKPLFKSLAWQHLQAWREGMADV